MKSATMPAAAEPSRLPVMVPASSRPIATCRCASGTRSDSIAMPSGNSPPQPAPAMTRRTNNCWNVVATAQRNDATVSTTRQPIITRFLPTESATGPSTGSTMP